MTAYFSGWELEGRRINRFPKVICVLCHMDPGPNTGMTHVASPDQPGRKQ